MNDFILGPQAPLVDTWFDTVQITKGKALGEACPATPPTDTEAQIIKVGFITTSYNMLHYYDLARNMYKAHRRTGDSYFLTLARKCADSYWLHPLWIGGGTIRPWPDSAVTPKFAGVGGLILRALDGKPEYWDWINSYTRFVFDHWVKKRIGANYLFYGVREGAFALQYAAWLAVAHPDAAIRAAYLADVQAAATGYYGRLQQPDGSWRWDDPDFLAKVAARLTSEVGLNATSLNVTPLSDPVAANMLVDLPGGRQARTSLAAPAGSQSISVSPLTAAIPSNSEIAIHDGMLIGIMQSFMVGFLLHALSDVYEIATDPVAKTNIGNQILKACRHLYSDGPYRKDDPVPYDPSKRWRCFWYTYHGGTTVNPTRFAKGGYSLPGNNAGEVGDQRQSIGPVVAAYGRAYQISGDPAFKAMGDELWDAAYVGTDGIRNLFDSDGKGYNQNARWAPSYPVWAGQPAVPPTPIPAPSPSPVTPSPDGAKGATITDSQLAVWTVGTGGATLRNGTHVGNGHVIDPYYKYFNKEIYGFAKLNSLWYRWTGTAWAKFNDGTKEPGVASVPDPLPTEPQYEFKKFRWPVDDLGQDAVEKQAAAEGWTDCYVAGNWLRCKRLKK